MQDNMLFCVSGKEEGRGKKTAQMFDTNRNPPKNSQNMNSSNNGNIKHSHLSTATM